MPRFFPVAGDSVNANDFGYERAGRGGHQGVDIFASEGTPLVAVDAGTVRFGTDPLGGNVANLFSDDGNHYYYAHLSAFEGANRRVAAGEVIGFVGTTGNARGTRAHVHFEVHPCKTGRCAVDPSPIINPLPRADQSLAAGGRDLSRTLRALALVTLGGGAAWAALNPSRAAQIVRRYV